MKAFSFGDRVRVNNKNYYSVEVGVVVCFYVRYYWKAIDETTGQYFLFAENDVELIGHCELEELLTHSNNEIRRFALTSYQAQSESKSKKPNNESGERQ